MRLYEQGSSHRQRHWVSVQTMLEVLFMKHHRILYRALSALLCLGLCAQLTACGKKPVPKPGSSGPSAPSVSKKVYDDSLITEVYDEEDSFTDEYDAEYSYICHVPQLEADTPEAKAIN